MLKNYIKIAFRNARRSPGFTGINVVGFALGLACCMFIWLFVSRELSYDQYHEKSDRIHRVVIDAMLGDQEINAPSSPPPMAATLMKDFPEVEHATRVFRSFFAGPEGVLIEHGDHRFLEYKLFYADSVFFDVFTHRAIEGNLATMLAAPNSIVFTESMAQKYFGDEEAILGKTVRMNNDSDYRITGVIKDVPAESHWHFDFLASLSTLPISREENWLGNPFTTYFVLAEEGDLQALETKLNAFVRKNVGPQMQEVMGMSIEEFLAGGGRYQYFFQPLTDIHLHSKLSYELQANSDVRYVYTFSVVAILILIIASFNFMNLATARSARRAKEVGVRKVLGSSRNSLAIQFLVESVLMCLLALAVALGIVWIALPYLNLWYGLNLTMPFESLQFIGMLAGAIVLIGLLSGIYPAFYLTSFMPASVLKGKIRTGAKSGSLRTGLVIAQFTISIVLIATTGLVYQQMQFMSGKALGFDREHVLILDQGMVDGLQTEVLKEEIRRIPGVVATSGLQNVPGKLTGDDAFRRIDAPENAFELLWMIYADEDIIDAMGMEMKVGEAFDLSTSRDSSMLILNQAAVDLFGWDYPVGERLTSAYSDPGQPPRVFDIAGVVEDFHFESLHNEIKPMAIELSNTADMEYLAIRVAPGRIPATLEEVESTWGTLYPGEPISLNFLDDQMNALYQADQRHSSLLGILTGFAIFIACLGLFGLAAYMTEQRVKEVGIRKIMGASSSSIVTLFSIEILKRILIAFAIGVPVALFAMQQWLERFAYKTTISWDVFLMAGILAVVVTLGTISYHSIRAAFTNPVDTLRYE